MVIRIIFLKLLILSKNQIFFFSYSNLNSSLANENVDQDFSYIEDEDDRKKCLDLFKTVI